MIRHVGIIRFNQGTSQEDIEAFAAAFMALEIEGMVARSAEPGIGLRGDKDADFVVLADFEDEAAFRRYDTDPDHEELRAGLAARVVAGGETCQYAL
jgi:hypothetical protein